jgi:hypothetical protein
MGVVYVIVPQFGFRNDVKCLLWMQYMGCSKRSHHLYRENTFTQEVCNPNSHQSSVLVTECTSSSGSAIFQSISVMALCEWHTAWPSFSAERDITVTPSVS